LKKWTIGIVSFIVVVVSIGLLAGSVKDLDPNEVAFDYDHNVGLIVDDTTLFEGGRHFLGLGHDFIKFPKTVQSLTIPSQTVRSADGLDILMDITVQFVFSPLNAETLKNIYYSFQDDYEPAFVYIIEGISRDVSAIYYAFDFYEKRAELQTTMLTSLRSIFSSNFSVSIEDLQLVDITLPSALSSEIQNTELARQDSLKAINERDVSELQLDTRRGQSYGDIDILYQDRDNKVNVTLTAALSQAETIKSIYTAESTALASILNALNLTNTEFEAYMFLKTLQETGANLHISIAHNQQLLP